MTTSEMRERLLAAEQGLRDLRPAVEAGDPWPLSQAFEPGPESTWGPLEVLAHVAEMLAYWFGQISQAASGGLEPVPFGRIETDPSRQQRIDRHRALPLGELYDRIAESVARYASWLSVLDEATLGRRGLHPTLGEIQVAAMFERFAIGHLEAHVAQLRETVGA